MKTIIIGGIASGMSAAAKLRRLDKNAIITVYEKSPYVSFGACGLPYYVGRFFYGEHEMIARTPEQHRDAGIEVYESHEVLKIYPDTKIVKVRNLITRDIFEDEYDNLMIATGATAIIPPINNIDLENVHTLKSLEDGEALRTKIIKKNIKHVSVIGAGFIGLEAVEAILEYKKQVSVFQLTDRILKDVFDKEVTDILETELRAHKVDLHLSTEVIALQGESKVTGIVTKDGKVIPTDLVIIATGVSPNTQFVKKTGIKMLSNGAIIVNNKGETSLPDVYAAGDCATVPHRLKANPTYIPLATVANKLGRIVGENLGGLDSTFDGSLGSSCIKVLDMEAGRTGLTESEAKSEGFDYGVAFVTDKNHTNYYPGQESIHVKLIYDKLSKVILGAQVVGKSDAVQRTNALAVAIYAGLTTNQLGMMDFCYAPPFSRTWDVMNVTGNVAK